MISEKRAVLVSAILASSMALIDSTALNVALPVIQNELELSGAELLWVVNGYLLFLSSLMLAGGATGDIYGKRKVFVFGIGFFAAASIGCGFSQSGFILILMRAIQGVGGAFMVPGSLALISAVYPAEERGKAIGYWSMFSAITTIGGPALGGYLASIGLWRGVFFINVPLALIALFLLLKYVEEPKIRRADAPPDWRGAIYSSLGFAGLVYAFLQAGERGFDKWHLWLIFASGVVLLIYFFFHEKKVAFPMLKLRLFKIPTFSAAAVITFLIYGGLGIFMYFLPLNLVQNQGYTSLQAGIAVLPFGGIIALMAPLTGKWTDRKGSRVPLILGPILTGVAFIGFTFFEQTEGWSQFVSTFLPFLALAGIGMGMTVVPVTSAIMGCVDEDDSGAASGISNAMSRLSGVIALSIVGMVSLLFFESHVWESFSDLSLSEAQKNRLEEEIAKFSGANPENLKPNIREKAEKAFTRGFFTAFDRSCYTAAALCWIGAILTFFFIPKTNQ